MARPLRWLLWLVPVLLVGLIFGLAYSRDHDFWRSTASLYQAARRAATRGDTDRAAELARKAWARAPVNSEYGVFLGRIYLDTGKVKSALEISRQMMDRQPTAGALVIHAQALDRLEQPQEALEVLAWCLNSHPHDRAVLATAAGIAAGHEEYHPLAVTYYRRLYKLDHDPQVRRVLVKLLASLDLYKEAIPLQEEEVAEFPDNREALHFLALLHYWQRDYRSASDIYQRLLEKGARSSELRLEAAKAASAAHQPDRALTQYLWLYARHRGQKEYALPLARLWAQKGNHAEAASVLAPLMSHQPDPQLRRWYALELLLIGDFAQAQTQYHKAWNEGDTHQETIINLARLYARKRRFGPAASMWDEAARRRLIKGQLRWEAALTYSYAHRYGDALKVIAPLRSQHPDDPKLLLFSGQLQFYQKHWGQAAHYFSKYLEKNPQDLEVRRQLAEVLSFKPETRPQALKQYTEALKIKDDVDLRLRRISLLLEDRRWAEAAAELDKCPTPQDPRLLREQAHLFLWLGRLPRALETYNLFLKKAPNDPRGRLEKARVLTYLGRGGEALALLNLLRLEEPQNLTVRVAAVEACLAGRDFPKALALAQKELEPSPQLTPEGRALLARCYAHAGQPADLYKALDLLIENLHKNRYHHTSLLLVAYILPRLPRYEDLNRLMYRLPGIRVGGPEYVAALSYFNDQLGRQAGKLNYLLHVLREYRRHRRPRSPGELLALASLAMELDNRPAAARYYKAALRLRPQDQNISNLLLQCQTARKEWGQVLDLLKQDPHNTGTPLQMARVYLTRRQFAGVKAVVAQIPPESPDYLKGQILLVQACRGEQDYPEALAALIPLEGKVSRASFLMEKARTLEAMGDREAVNTYQEIIDLHPGSQVAHVARARQSRTRGNLAAAHQEFTRALETAPQDVELLNELEDLRLRMRPELASRGFPASRGERRPAEAQRPWQFSGLRREPRGLGLSNYLPALVSDVLPVVQPESLYLNDSNHLYGGIFRIAGGFWITKVLPAQLGIEYREYNQNTENAKVGPLNLGLSKVYEQQTVASSRLRRAEVSLGLGPVAAADRLKISGEIILRRYWKRDDFFTVQRGEYTAPGYWNAAHTVFIVPQVVTNVTRGAGFSSTDDQNRLLGTLQLDFSPWARTDTSLRYSRRDIFDQEAYLFPRLYQSILNLTQARVTTYHQVDLAYNHQFLPGLDWRGNIAGAFYSDQNRRFTLYQGLKWQALHQPRLNLEFTPHYFLATYKQQHQAYFSPGAYHAIGLGVDFDKQIYRLPTLILQGTVQAVGQHGEWGPSLQGLAALEWEFIQNFYMDVHVFYFREWVDDYRLLTAGASFRWRF